ncbi:MAG: insulinase family protein, partial [Calditrichaeota bacterium]|nr:insulinase family protein [Calditrichota bacterium]
YYAMGLIDQIILQGEDSRLHQSLVKKNGFTGNVNGGINLLGNMFNYNGPMLWMASLFYDSSTKQADIITAVDAEMEKLSKTPVNQATLDRAIIKLRSNYYDNVGGFFGIGRADLLCSFALFDDNPERINNLEAEFRKVTPELIRKTAAEYLRKSNRTILTINPTKKAQP